MKQEHENMSTVMEKSRTNLGHFQLNHVKDMDPLGMTLENIYETSKIELIEDPSSEYK